MMNTGKSMSKRGGQPKRGNIKGLKLQSPHLATVQKMWEKGEKKLEKKKKVLVRAYGGGTSPQELEGQIHRGVDSQYGGG